MNWTRTILDGIVLCIIFNAVVGLFFFVIPQAYSTMFPKEMKKAAAPYITKKEYKILGLVLFPLYLIMLVYIAVSAHSVGVTGFWNLFWTGYIEMMFVNIGDFVILDCLGRIYVKDKKLIKGCEGHPDWEWKGWWKLAVPEHFLGWPLIFCPLAGFICAGISTFLI